MSSPDARLFIAITPPTETRQRVAQYAAALQAHPALRNAKWTATEQYHITLKFLGQTPIEQIADLLDAVRALNEAAANDRVDIRLASLVAFPHRSPRVLALACDEGSSERLRDIHDRLHTQLANRLPDFPPPQVRAFRPHLTLARFRRSVGSLDTRNLSSPPEVTMPVRIELVRSELTPSGAIHTRVDA